MKIKSITQLNTWKEGHKLVILVYKMLGKLPTIEKYAISDQMRRSVVSITSNIAEGFSRKTKKEKIQFYFTAKGSLTELQNQLLIVKDLHYITNNDFTLLAEQTIRVHKLLNGLVNSAEDK